MNTHKVLIVDEDTRSLRLLESVLLEAGFTVITAPTGKEGLISAWRDRPEAIVIDPNLSDINPVELLGKLKKDPRTAGCTYIAFSSYTDPETIQQVHELDFEHVFTKGPDQLANIILAINGDSVPSPQVEEAPPVLPTPDEEELPDGKLIVFLSAKGGTGTSSVCANLATCLADVGTTKGIAVVDLVLPIGSIGPLVGYSGLLNVVDVSKMSQDEADVTYFQSSLPRINNWRFQLLSGSPHPETADKLEISRVPDILKTLQHGYSFVFVDLGTSLSRISLPIILNADQVVLVLSPDISTVTLTETVLDFLLSKDLRTDRLFPILNRAVGLEGLSRMEIEAQLDIKIMATVPYMGGNFTLSNNQDMPVVRKFPHDSASIEMRDIARQIDERTTLQRERDQAGV